MGFNPNQPRVPAGGKGGGQWTAGSSPHNMTGARGQTLHPIAAPGKTSWQGKGAAELSRHLGSKGLDFKQTREALGQLGVHPADNTIRIQMARGKKGEALPHLTPDQHAHLDSVVHGVRSGQTPQQSGQAATSQAKPQTRSNDYFAQSHVRVDSPVSESFKTEVRQAAASIPDSIHARMALNGQQVRVAEHLTDSMPELKGVTPRGWPKGMTWDAAEGAANGSTILVSEKLKGCQSCPSRVSDRIPGVYRHEYGHTVDNGWNRGGPALSNDPAFHAAHRQDVAALSPVQRDNYSYFLQRGSAGRDETFAEAFAARFGGGAHHSGSEEFKRAFPHSYAAVGKLLGV